MHCFRRAASRLQLSNASPSSITSSTLISRSRCSAPSTLVAAATRFAYPSAIQTRWNSTDGPEDSSKNGPKFTFNETITPERNARRYAAREHRSRDFLSDGPVPKATLYIGNLFFDVTAEDLRKHFEQFGTVESALIVHDARGLSKGFGYLTYTSTEEATDAITQQNGSIYEGREIVVNYANTVYRATRREEQPSSTVYVGNIPYELTDVDLQQIFEDIQGVTDVRIPVDRRTGLPRGFGHVDFADVESAAAAKELLSRKAPYGRKLTVNFAKRKILTPGDHARHQGKKLEKKGREAERKGNEPSQPEITRGIQEPGTKA